MLFYFIINNMEKVKDIEKNIIIKAYLNEYGLDNCISSFLFDENITGLKSLSELEELLIKHDNSCFNRLRIIKRNYMTYIINNYYNGNYDKIYNELNIKDQEIDLGNSIALKKLNNSIKL